MNDVRERFAEIVRASWSDVARADRWESSEAVADRLLAALGEPVGMRLHYVQLGLTHYHEWHNEDAAKIGQLRNVVVTPLYALSPTTEAP